MAIKSLACFYFIVFCIISVPVHAEQLEIPGTGACETILNELAVAFNDKNRKNKIIITPSVGSGGGIRLVGTGVAQLARVARPLNEKEKQYSLKDLIFAKDPIVFAVGNKVGVNDLSAQQLGDVFSGKYENWREVGGNNQRIRLLIREPQDSSLLVIQKVLPPFKGLPFSEKAKSLFHDYEMVNALNKYSTVIGWLTNSSMKDVKFTVKAISVDGIKATRENILAGKYKLISDYSFVYKTGELSGLAKEFVDFVFSEKGRIILSNAGMVAVDSQEQ
jgi:phosphate transport system substrate-binding protein